MIIFIQDFDLLIYTYLKSGDVPLGIAAGTGHVLTVERLLQAKTNINYQNKVRNNV